VTPNIFQPSYPSPHLLTIANQPFDFLLRKKTVDGKNMILCRHLRSIDDRNIVSKLYYESNTDSVVI
jgi:hypothetical protein